MLKEFLNICAKFTNKFNNKKSVVNRTQSEPSTNVVVSAPVCILDRPNRIYRPLRPYSGNQVLLQVTPRGITTSVQNRTVKTNKRLQTVHQMKGKRNLSTKMSMSVEDSSEHRKNKNKKMIPPQYIKAMENLVKKRQQVLNEHWIPTTDDFDRAARAKAVFERNQKEVTHIRQVNRDMDLPRPLEIERRLQAERIYKAHVEDVDDLCNINENETIPEERLDRAIYMARMRHRALQQRARADRADRAERKKESSLEISRRARVQAPVLSYAECELRQDPPEWNRQKEVEFRRERQLRLQETAKKRAYHPHDHNITIRKYDSSGDETDYEDHPERRFSTREPKKMPSRFTIREKTLEEKQVEPNPNPFPIHDPVAYSAEEEKSDPAPTEPGREEIKLPLPYMPTPSLYVPEPLPRSSIPDHTKPSQTSLVKGASGSGIPPKHW